MTMIVAAAADASSGRDVGVGGRLGFIVVTVVVVVHSISSGGFGFGFAA